MIIYWSHSLWFMASLVGVMGWGVGVGDVLCENCIVDASIFIFLVIFVCEQFTRQRVWCCGVFV